MCSATVTGFADTEALAVLEAELAEVCGQLNVLHARLVGLTAEALASGAWGQWGIHTPAHWLAWKAGLDRAHAHTLVRLAKRREELPVTFGAFAAGELSVDQVAPIVAKVPAWADTQVCELARSATPAQIRAAVGRYPFTDTPTPAPATREPYVSLVHGDDGRYRLSGLLDEEQGRLVDTALAEAKDALFRRDHRPASLADALVELAQRSLDTVTGTARRNRYRIHVHVDVDATPVMTDDAAQALPDWWAGLIAGDATLTRLFERDGRPLGVGDTSSTIPAAVRRHVHRRDRCCRIPGCGGRYVELHHIRHRDDGGDHDPANLVALCPFHHRLHHRGRLGITGNAEDPHGLTFTDHHGQPLPPGPVARPPTSPPPDATPYRHPTGERLHQHWIHFTPPRDVVAS